jgi:2-phosphoglycerate kinase
MMMVRDGTRDLPFADAVLARTLMVTGLPDGTAIEVAAQVGDRLHRRPTSVVHIEDVRTATREVLADRGETEVLRRLRVRWWLGATRQPVVIAIGGTSGVGKSTVAAGAAGVLGIEAVMSTDLVRAVLRGTLNPDLIPALSESSFSAQRMLRSNIEGNRLLLAFEQQAAIVEQASVSLARRALKEGMQLVLEGVHVVPGLVAVPDDWPLLRYVLTVPDVAEHERRFTARFVTSDRDPQHYLARIRAIRELDEYIVAHSREAGIPVIESSQPDQTVYEMVGAIASDLERTFGL